MKSSVDESDTREIFEGAQLDGTTLSPLEGVDLREAKLNKAKLWLYRRAYAVELKEANLLDADLSAADMERADLTGARLDRADRCDRSQARSGPL